MGIRKEKAEALRMLLIERGLVRKDIPVTREKGLILFPVDEKIDFSTIINLGYKIHMVKRDLEPRKRFPNSYKELLDLEEDLQDSLPSSYDVIGELALIKLPESLYGSKFEIGEALRKFNRNIKTVALDRGVEGDFRIRNLEVISGNENLETIHIENNLRFKLDPSLVYFSPRLATERMRVASLVGNERVLDMFAGVGPFSLTIGRYGEPEQVIGVDLNPDCIRYFNTNILLNSLDDIVQAFLGDAREITPTFGSFDRVIMNLPHSSIDFLDVALQVVKKGVIHLYLLIENLELMNEIQKIMKISIFNERKISIIGTREVHNYSPGSSIVVIDIQVVS